MDVNIFVVEFVEDFVMIHNDVNLLLMEDFHLKIEYKKMLMMNVVTFLKQEINSKHWNLYNNDTIRKFDFPDKEPPINEK